MKNLLKYYIITYGCQMNHSDSERMSGVLENLGLQTVNNEKDADVIIINACSVRQKAIDRIWGRLKEFEKIKAQRNGRPLYTVLTGCVLPLDKIKFLKKFDLYFPINKLGELPDKLKRVIQIDCHSERAGRFEESLTNVSLHTQEISRQVRDDKKNNNKNYFQTIPNYSSKFSALVPIMTGCNSFCTYCAVPYTRGPEISRKPEEIICEVETLLAKGYKEITLLGQIVNKYMVKIDNSFFGYLENALNKYSVKLKNIPELQENDLRKKHLFKFHHLLTVLANLKSQRKSVSSSRQSSIWWLRFSSSHPKWFTKKLTDTIKKYDNIVEHIHLPVQSGSNSVLKRMLRPYTIKEYKNIIKYIRQEIPDASITTDVIVGFCKETDKEFNETKKLFKWAKFDMAYIAQYSPRPGTKAQLTMKDDVFWGIKQKREKELNEILKKTALEYNKKYIGEEVKVLITKIKNGKTFGRTRMNKNIKILNSHPELARLAEAVARQAKGSQQILNQVQDNNLIGQFVQARVTHASPWNLEGEIINS